MPVNQSLSVDSTDVTNVNIVTSNRINIINAGDAVGAFTWLDFGLSTQRISTIVYTSATVLPGHSATKTFAWSLNSGSYRLDSITWSYV